MLRDLLLSAVSAAASFAARALLSRLWGWLTAPRVVPVRREDAFFTFNIFREDQQ